MMMMHFFMNRFRWIASFLFPHAAMFLSLHISGALQGVFCRAQRWIRCALLPGLAAVLMACGFEGGTASNETDARTVDLAVDHMRMVYQNENEPVSNLEVGQSFTAEFTMANHGANVYIQTTLYFYASLDQIITPEDIQVGTAQFGFRSPEDEKENTLVATIPGTYYYGVCADTVTGELNASNNCSAGAQITVREDAPGDRSTTVTIPAEANGGTELRGRIATGDEEDWYRITLTEGFRYGFQVEESGDRFGIRPALTLYRGNEAGSEATGISGEIDYTVPTGAGGTYYISILGTNVDYTLFVTKLGENNWTIRIINDTPGIHTVELEPEDSSVDGDYANRTVSEGTVTYDAESEKTTLNRNSQWKGTLPCTVDFSLKLDNQSLSREERSISGSESCSGVSTFPETIDVKLSSMLNWQIRIINDTSNTHTVGLTPQDPSAPGHYANPTIIRGKVNYDIFTGAIFSPAAEWEGILPCTTDFSMQLKDPRSPSDSGDIISRDGARSCGTKKSVYIYDLLERE